MGRIWSKLLVVAVLVSGCTINKDIMFKTPTDYEFDVMPDSTDPQFKLQTNDVLDFRIFANDGFRLIDLVNEDGNDNRNIQRNTFKYLIEYDGQVKMPLLGRVHIAGMTVREAELWLEERYVQFYNRPFVQLSVSNRRVVVFPGDGGEAQVITLENNNTTLLEVMAESGGIARRGRADIVKVFRKAPDGHRLVFQFDLSDINGLKYGDMVMQSDDVVYIQPNPEIARELLYDLTPLITLLTSIVLVIGVVNGLSK